jgi:ABC-2 type transport system ATP-binding protein
VIEVEALTKSYRVHERPPGVAAALRSLFHRSYRQVEAVRAIGFRIAPGERVGFLGPNGAGKTTTLKMLAGLLAPTSGSARVCGFTPFERSPDFLRSIMLVAGQKQQLLWDLPPSDTFELNRAIYGVSPADFRSTRDELVELLKLEPLLGKPVRQLSLGERMKCELAAALLHRPRVLFLDEPTIGLDVTMQVVVRDFIRRYNERYGAAVILTSHYMDDVAALCPRIIVIDRGQLVWDGPLAELVHKLHPEKRVVLKLAKAVSEADVSALGARVIALSAGEAQLRVPPGALGRVVGAAMQTLPVVDLLVEDAPLEEVMSTLFARQP